MILIRNEVKFFNYLSNREADQCLSEPLHQLMWEGKTADDAKSGDLPDMRVLLSPEDGIMGYVRDFT